MLTASAHGAGFMLLPILLGMSAVHGDHMAHMHHSLNGSACIVAVALHTFAYLLVTGTVAWLVYNKVGLAMLRRAWFNLDRIWAISLILMAAITLLMNNHESKTRGSRHLDCPQNALLVAEGAVSNRIP